MGKRVSLLALFFLASSVSLAAPENLKASHSFDQSKQAEYKAAYLKAKEGANRRRTLGSKNKPIRQKPITHKQLPQVSCEGVACSVKKSTNKIVRTTGQTTDSLAATVKQKASYWFSRGKRAGRTASYWFRRNVLREPALLTNLPPTLTGFYQERRSSGSRPIVQMSTNEALSDPDGTVESVEWDFGDGSSMVMARSEVDDYAYVLHTYPVAAHYEATVTVCDDLNACTSVTDYVEISNNQIPVVNFTMDTDTGSSPLTVNFTSNSFDPENRLANLEWDFGDGSPREFGSDTTPSHEYTSSGTYEVTLRAWDHDRGVQSARARVYVDVSPPVEGQPPSVVMDSTNRVGRYPLTVQFDASRSFVINGDVGSYEWDFGDYNYPDNFSSDATPEHTFHEPGTYFARLRVKNTTDASTDFYFPIFVEGDSVLEPMIVAYQYDDSRYIEFEGNFFALRSNVDYGQYMWDFGDGNTSSGAFQGHEYAIDGTYTVKLVALDVHGVRHEVTKNITVTDTRDVPNNSSWIENYNLALEESTTFHGEDSTDPAQSLALEYHWDFGDGATDDVATPSHSYGEKGLYFVQFIVTNTRGLSDRQTESVTVVDGSNPITELRYSPKIGTSPLSVDFDASNSRSEGATITSYVWRIDDKTFYGPTQTYVFNDPGTYFIDLYIYDSAGNVGHGTKKVMVIDSGSIPGGNLAPTASFIATQDPTPSRWYHLDGWASSDPDGYVAYYEWKINGQVIKDGGDIWYQFPDYNIYQVELTVYDEWGASNTTSQQIDLSSVTNMQLAFDYAPIKPIAGETIRFGAENAVIPGSTIVSYAWDFGDSNTGSGVSPTHTYASAGTYTVELEITDNASNTFRTSQNVVVAAAVSNPTLKLSIRDVDMLRSVTNSGTYTGTSFPETVFLSVTPSSSANRFIRKATWDLGNGESAYGPDVEYTYKKPGTYNISVTGYDANGNSNTASATIVIPADCKRLEGETTCLSLPSIVDNIFPFSQAGWVVQKTGNFSGTSKYFPARWIHLKALDGSDDVIDLSGLATIASNQITINKQALVDKNINFRRAYKLVVDTVDSSGNGVLAEWPILHFGAGQMSVSAGETGVRLTITNPSAQFKKYVDMDSNTSVNLKDLPLGPTSVVAEKNGVTAVSEVDLKFNEPAAVTVDVSPFIGMQKRKLVSASKKMSTRMSFNQAWKSREMKYSSAATHKTSSHGFTDSWPGWALGLCGEEPPFSHVRNRVLSSGQAPDWSFSSADPLAQSTFRAIPDAMTKPVRLSCAISTESLNYGYTRWKYKDGPGRCFNDDKPNWFWGWYLSHLSFEDELVTIKYEVQDDWTTDSYTGYLVTSASDLMRKQGRSLNDISQRVGIVPDGDQDWSYRQNFDIYIPPQFKRPQIRFELSSQDSQVPDQFYAVNCDVISSTAQPKIVKFGPTAFNDSGNRASRNGQFSLQKRFKYFPIHFDDRSGSAVDADSNTSQAEYEVGIRYYNQSTITWTGVEIEYSYNGTTHIEGLSFDGVGSDDSVQQIYTNYFLLDTASLSGVFEWQPGEDRIRLTIKPVGEDADNNPVEGVPWTEEFVALFDAQTIQADESKTICGRGFFGSNLTTFAQDGLLRSLAAANDGSLGIRCGNMSLPFGGPMDVSGLTQNTYQHGTSVKTLTFNVSQSDQDSYDGTNASTRKGDIDAYKTFSDSALTISQITNEYVMGNPTDKKKIYDYCHPSVGDPKYPCRPETTFSDLDHDMVLQICQWYSDSGSEIDGCPTGYLTKVIRFSKWAKQNAGELMAAKTFGLIRPTLATGRGFDLTAYQEYQRKALVYGVWPDGKPIWDVSTGGAELAPKRLIDCHDQQKGCERLKDAFVNDGYYLGAMELLNGWRL